VALLDFGGLRGGSGSRGQQASPTEPVRFCVRQGKPRPLPPCFGPRIGPVESCNQTRRSATLVSPGTGG
jgi:hypothetical protein